MTSRSVPDAKAIERILFPNAPTSCPECGSDQLRSFGELSFWMNIPLCEEAADIPSGGTVRTVTTECQDCRWKKTINTTPS